MSDDKRPDLRAWLGFRRPFDYTRVRPLGPVLSGLSIVVVGGLFFLALAAAFGLLGRAVFGTLLETPGSALGAGGVTVALIGAPFVIWRSIVAQKSVDVQERGQITDRINKAVELMGNEEPSVRMGAILTFDRIMKDSPNDKLMVLKMLNVYIEYHQPAHTSETPSPIQDTSIDVQAALDVLLKWRDQI